MRYLFIILTVLITPAWCQKEVNHSVSWGNEFKMKAQSQMIDVFGITPSNYYALRMGNRGFYIETLDKELNLVSSKEIELDYKKKEMQFEGILQVQNKFIVFSSFSNQKLRKNFLFYRVVPISTLDQNGTITKIAEIDYLKKQNDGYFAFTHSDDTSKVLVYSSLQVEEDGPERFSLAVLDSSMNLLWRNNNTIRSMKRPFSVERIDVSASGNVYVSGVTRNLYQNSKRTGKPDYDYRILTFADNGTNTIEHKVDLENLFITDLQFALDSAENMICSGLYSERGTFSVKGAFYQRIDNETNTVQEESILRLPRDFITRDWTDREKRRSERKEERKGQTPELYEYDLRDIILREDGSLILMAEQYYMKSVTTSDYAFQGQMSTRTVDHYYYNDILILNINPQGEFEWYKNIEKYQHSKNDGGYFSSFLTVKTDSLIHLIYNESADEYFSKEERSELERDEKRAYFTVIVTIDEDGNYSKSPLFDNKEQGVRTRPKVCEQITDDKVIIYAKWYKKQRFALLNFKTSVID